MTPPTTDRLTIDDLRRCVEGRIPPVMATADSDGEPNIVFVSAVHVVDEERIALSNQFMGKTAANLNANPQASLILVDPHTGLDYRLHILFERTERRGPTFQRLKVEVDEIAAMTGKSDVFRLRSADIYRIERIEIMSRTELRARGVTTKHDFYAHLSAAEMLGQVAALTRALSRCGDLDSMVSAVVRGLDEVLGYKRSMVMMLDERGEKLFTIASHGFAHQGVGSEVALGDGAAGLAAQQNRPVRLGGLHHTGKYAASVGRSFAGPGDIELPVSLDTRSRLAVPAVSRGQVLGVIVVESHVPAAFDDTDEAVLGIIGAVVAEMADLDHERTDDTEAPARPEPMPAAPAPPEPTVGAETHVRFFASDGSVFLDGDYLIRGVAGRVLWSLVQRHTKTGQVEFSHKEIRLDKTLDLPGFRDNLDTRIILLKRRLEERQSPIQLEKTGRGRIALRRTGPLRLEAHD